MEDGGWEGIGNGTHGRQGMGDGGGGGGGRW